MTYRTKTVAELLYIVKDAGEAAQAMRGHDAQAEGKYLDQVNDASTELHRRRQAQLKKIRRNEREQAMRDLGLTKVKGALGGTYWE